MTTTSRTKELGDDLPSEMLLARGGNSVFKIH